MRTVVDLGERTRRRAAIRPGLETPAGPNGALLRPTSPQAVQWLQGSAGNASVGRLLAGPVLQRAAITPESIGKALDKVTVESAKTRAVASLRPWVIFETLPWNPSDGKKSRLFTQLRKAFTAQIKAEAALADAKKRDTAATAGGKATPAAKPTAAPKRKRKGRKAKVLPTAAEAQAAVDAAKAKVDSITKELKTYVKSKLNTARNPRMTAAIDLQKSTKKERAAVDAQLRTARKRRRPDQAEVDRLTKLRTTKKAAEDAANTAAGALLTRLRAEIDAADWTMQDVTRTTTVYQVEGARATLYDRVEAYATVTAGGFEGKAERTGTGGPTVPELLDKDATLGVSAKKILAIISAHEGDFTSVNTWDIADVTWGMVQWTTGASGRGDLIRALSIIKATAPAAFESRLVAYGIDVDPDRGIVLTRADGSVLTGVAAAKTIQTDGKLSAVLAAAGTDPQIQAAELHAANEIEVKGALSRRLSAKVGSGATASTVQVPVSALITSEFGVGVLANHTVHGGFPGGKLQSALTKYLKAHPVANGAKVADWAPNAETDLVNSISTGADAGRIAVMRKQLDTAAGSFR